MRRIEKLGLLSVGVIALACSPVHDGGEAAGKSVAPIINGDVMSDADSLRSPAVLIQACKKDPHDPPLDGECQLGSGMMLSQTTPDGRNIVLTARHMVDRVGDGSRVDPTRIEVFHGNPATWQIDAAGKVVSTHIQGRPEIYGIGKPGPHPRFPFDLWQEDDDIAILFLDRQLARPETVLPELDCDEPDPDEILCESAIHHTLSGSGQFLPDFKVNTGIFQRGSPSLKHAPSEMVFDPNHTAQQATFPGDSGCGCLDSLSLKLSVVHVAGGASLFHDFIIGKRPLDNSGFATKVQPLCNWIKAAIATGSKVAFETDIGDGDGVEDVVALTQIAGDSHTLTIDRSAFPDQSFNDVTNITGDLQLNAGAIGKFTGGKPALVVAADGDLVGAGFNGGPEPLIDGAPSSDYTALAKARVNSDTNDDLIAQRSDGQVDVFLGGTSGLQFNANIKPVPMRLDRDRLPDYVWLDGAKINTFSTVAQDAAPPGLTSRTVIPNTLSLVKVAPGLFRDFALETPGPLNGGIQDIVTLSSAGTGGAVIWCESTGFGLQCNPALDWQNNTGRIATDFEVGDVNGDGFDDIVVSYSNQDTAPQTFLGSPHGFVTPFGGPNRHVGGLDANGDGEKDTIKVNEETPTNVGPPKGNIKVDLILADGTLFGPFVLPIPFMDPMVAVIGNFNGDQGGTTALANAAVSGQHPIQDIAILSGDRVFALISNGDGTFTVNAPPDATGFVSIDAGDVTGDGIDDLEATRADGSVTVFKGVAGSGGVGLEATGNNFTGLPTPETNDGKMVVLSGLGVDTVAATDARFKLTVGPEDSAALDHLTVQIFDGDNHGLHQFENETNVLKTCYRLSADPCGDGSLGNCNGGTRPKVEITTVSSDTLNDDVWDTIFEGPHSADASLPGTGEPPFIYELYVYLSEDCNVLPTTGSTIPIATADAFKVRSNAMVSHPAGELSIVGSDSDGPHGIAGQSYMRDTNYDGIFSLPIAVGASATEIQLKEADADDTEDATPGVSLGANAAISYQLLQPDGTPASVVGAEDVTPTTLVSNPSGNNDGAADGDVETRIATLATSTPGTWTWQWQDVMAANAIHFFGPFGSPTTHEVLGARRERPTTSTAMQPYFWDDDAKLAASLPVVLGTGLSDGSLQGQSILLTTVTEAKGILANAAGTREGELQRQLLVVKLNIARSLGLGEDLNGALVYGTTTSVRTTVKRADDTVSGAAVWVDDKHVDYLVTMLSSVNLGQITYQDTGVPFSQAPMADDDSDGVLNVKDNCPTVTNPLQEKSHGDTIGDACRVHPVADCVLQRSAARFDAFFTYDNPLSFRIIPVGARNVVKVNGYSPLEVRQPTELVGGNRVQAFAASFDGVQPVSWTLDGETAQVTSSTSRCGGSQLTRTAFAERVALFGTESVEVGDYASVIAQGGLPSIVSNGDVTLGADVVAGDVLAGGRTVVGMETLVSGSVVTGGGLSLQSGAIVTGLIRDGVKPPPHSIEWLDDGVTAPSSLQVGSGGDSHLEPGSYGAVVVQAGGVLTLESGTFEFESLSVAADGTLALASGEVVVHVRSTLSHLGETRGLDTTPHITLGYFGSDPAHIAASLRGVVVAPNAELILGSARNMDFIGAFFARRVTVLPGTIVEFAAFE